MTLILRYSGSIEKFDKFVRSLVLTKELESTFVNPPGVIQSEASRSVRQQELETTAKNEKGKPLAVNTMDMYMLPLGLYKVSLTVTDDITLKDCKSKKKNERYKHT